jgi:hypothetical protein
MSDVPQLGPSIQRALDLASRCTRAETSDNYGALSDQVEELEGQARAAFQSKMDFAPLLPKLKAGRPLTISDLRTLEVLIVGDAESYVDDEPEVRYLRSPAPFRGGARASERRADLARSTSNRRPTAPVLCGGVRLIGRFAGGLFFADGSCSGCPRRRLGHSR